jgi:hypothetical protein
MSLVVLGFAAPACVDADADGEQLASQSLESRRLAYRPVDITAGPASLDGWSPVGLADDGAVYGQGFDCNDDFSVCNLPLVKRARDGAFSVVHPNFLVNDVDERGDAGGCTIDDPATFFGHAAVVTAGGALRIIPALPGELTACVSRIADDRVMAIDSFDEAFNATTYVLDRGRITPLTVAGSIQDLNDHGQAAGITFTADGGRAFRFDADSATTTILEPIAGDPESWAMAIDKHGDVLGYSFVAGGVERVGSWDAAGAFSVAFVEGTPEYPTVSNKLTWNDAGLIAISDSRRDGKTFLVPAPGTRLDLAELVGGAEIPTTMIAQTVNRGGDLLTFSRDDGRAFLFIRE